MTYKFYQSPFPSVFSRFFLGRVPGGYSYQTHSGNGYAFSNPHTHDTCPTGVALSTVSFALTALSEFILTETPATVNAIPVIPKSAKGCRSYRSRGAREDVDQIPG